MEDPVPASLDRVPRIEAVLRLLALDSAAGTSTSRCTGGGKIACTTPSCVDGPAGQYQLAIISVPREYSVPATQSNPITFQLNEGSKYAETALALIAFDPTEEPGRPLAIRILDLASGEQRTVARPGPFYGIQDVDFIGLTNTLS
jgi:hypothetical protein